jgi:hypothetical protein
LIRYTPRNVHPQKYPSHHDAEVRMTERIDIKIQNADGGTVDRALEISKEISNQPQCKLILLGAHEEKLEFVAEDFFEALIALRHELAQSGQKVLCAGARRDVFPSGMSRSMGLARKAYRMRLGVATKMDDLVDIFSFAGAESIGTVEEQELFFQQWVKGPFVPSKQDTDPN